MIRLFCIYYSPILNKIHLIGSNYYFIHSDIFKEDKYKKANYLLENSYELIGYYTEETKNEST